MAHDPINVRPVELADAVPLRQNCFSRNTLEEVRARIEASLKTSEQQRGIRLVAAVDGVVVGTILLTRNAHPLMAHRAELDDLVVHGDYRRRGIARRLLIESCVYVVSMGVEILEVSCRAGTAAEKAYPRLGFVEYGRLPRGIIEPFGGYEVFDVVYFYLPIEQT
jgi:GNAT superfamily N-acetyltransferase